MKNHERPEAKNFIFVDRCAVGDMFCAWISPLPGISMIAGYGEKYVDAINDLRSCLIEEAKLNRANIPKLILDIIERLEYMKQVPISMWK